MACAEGVTAVSSLKAWALVEATAPETLYISTPKWFLVTLPRIHHPDPSRNHSRARKKIPDLFHKDGVKVWASNGYLISVSPITW